MTDNEARALGERWIKASGGRLDGGVYRWIDAIESSRVRADGPDPSAGEGWPGRGWWPDLRDPATRGAALEVVRERWGEPSYALTAVDESCHPIRWEWVDGGLAAPMLDHKIGYQQFDSEAEALVAALEAFSLR